MPFGTMAPDSFASIKYPDQFIIIRWRTRIEEGSVRIQGCTKRCPPGCVKMR